jgi:PAS domain S-box-containing protein
VLDVEWPAYDVVLGELSSRAPWMRAYLIADRVSDPIGRFPPLICKPFDAAAVAEMLERECEVASLERRRRVLAANAEELGLLLRSSLEAIVGLDRSEKIVFWNRGAEQVYGYSEIEALGAPISLLASELVHAEGDRPNGNTELKRRHKSGREVVVLVSRSYTEQPRTEARSLHCAEVSLDVTQRRALERELEHSKRLAHLGRIAATLSHEINNPLAAIRSYSNWLLQRARKSRDDELIEVSNDLDSASERIATFVDQMTGFARRGSPRLEHTSLSHSLGLSLRMVRPRAEANGVTLVDEVSSESSPVVWHDPTRLGHALINVLSNAIDAAGTGGHRVWIRVALSDASVSIEVDDNGHGIPAEHKERVFEPFFTTKRFGRGTGLGLWLTEQIIQDHGGQVVIHDRPGGGTRVRFTLPVREGDA